jgi:hypothetical protein
MPRVTVRETDFTVSHAVVTRSELGTHGFEAYLSAQVMLKTDMADDRSKRTYGLPADK